MVSFVVDHSAPMLWGGELVVRNGEPSGQVSSAAWGETSGASVGLAYVWDRGGDPITLDWVRAGSYEVNVGGVRHAVTVSTKSLYDPGNERIRG